MPCATVSTSIRGSRSDLAIWKELLHELVSCPVNSTSCFAFQDFLLGSFRPLRPRSDVLRSLELRDEWSAVLWRSDKQIFEGRRGLQLRPGRAKQTNRLAGSQTYAGFV